MARRFPDRFLFGAATSAYQIEGSPLADGAGPSNWHRFSHTPGHVVNGENGDVACDHYNRWREDIALMRELGLNAYRFSISWSRVLPEGTGRVNQKGLDFYRQLVDQLGKAGIAPMATLYHWDLPAALDDRGGWLNRDIAGWFAEYAQVCFRALDDGVAMWATLNEPWVVVDAGYLHGVHAPGHRNWFEAPIAAHNLLRAHATAVQAYRLSGKKQIGLVVNLEPKYPASHSEEDAAALRRADAYMNRQYLDPLFLGAYPAELVEMFGQAWPSLPATDFDLLGTPFDFLGINYYKRAITAFDPSVPLERAKRLSDPQRTHTTLDWEVFPQGLTDILLWVAQRYGRQVAGRGSQVAGKLPLYVTENGAAFYDPPVARDGVIDDPLRIAYYRDHLNAVLDAIDRGADVRGYFAWSLLDNFEWSAGYSKRFGLIHVDYATQKRTIKNSGRFYADVIRQQGL